METYLQKRIQTKLNFDNILKDSVLLKKITGKAKEVVNLSEQISKNKEDILNEIVQKNSDNIKVIFIYKEDYKRRLNSKSNHDINLTLPYHTIEMNRYENRPIEIKNVIWYITKFHYTSDTLILFTADNKLYLGVLI